MKWLWQSLAVVAVAIIVPGVIVMVLAVQYLVRSPNALEEAVQESAEAATKTLFEETQEELQEQFPAPDFGEQLSEGINSLSEQVDVPDGETLNRIGEEVLENLKIELEETN